MDGLNKLRLSTGQNGVQGGCTNSGQSMFDCGCVNCEKIRVEHKRRNKEAAAKMKVDLQKYLARKRANQAPRAA